ncbi:exosome complex component RRP42 [Tribolium castaneum]|uniref:Ribosomal RNA-processing protein 42 n=1 Tax=Tribolium castaneum TaxID=7070 RepID=D6WDU3_TRICA|nr:PREDICTED: exosome complex component RRP42 [Tribolium castaneum]EEZ99918.1 Exosome complex component RRP42-like Protein [Tribolium castaneum]|eukprot:XP_008191163.1 PREDICTED: exosome complex component RRP42 [Tribolium castaneum]
MALCEAEKTFVLHGVEENFRVDGREREDYRPIELETNIVSHAFGSARLRLANTDVLVAVKIEVDVPYPERPKEGKLEFFVDCSANATPDFEGRGGEDLAIEISNSLSAAYKSPEVFDLTKLCILKGHKCWKIFVDILLLECGGNLYDAVSIAVKAALWDTRIPLVKSVTVDGNNVDMEVSDELHDCQKLDVTAAPIMVTVCKIGEQCIVDPNVAEELCSVGAVVIAVSKDKFSTVLQIGSGSLHPQTLLECLQMGEKVAQRLSEALTETLSEINPNKNQDVGFLK